MRGKDTLERDKVHGWPERLGSVRIQCRITSRENPMIRFLLAFMLMFNLTLVAGADEKVEFTLHSGHFEKNNAGLKGDASFLLIADKKPNLVPKGAFEKKLVAAVIHRGNAMWTYDVEKVSTEGETLTVRYKAVEGKAGSAKFASPMILTVDKGKIKKVVFVENGKEVGAAEVGK